MESKVVVVGCGWAGEVHATVIDQHIHSKLVAVVDPSVDKAESLGSRFHVPTFRSLQELYKTNIDFHAVSVCTPTESHFSLCQDLIVREKEVFCEKPLTSNTEEAAILQQLAANKKVKLRLNYNQRFASPIQKLKEYITKDAKTHMLQISMFQHPPQLATATNEFYLVTDACCHLIDTFLFLNGEVEEVHAYGSRFANKMLSDVTVNLKFKNNSIGMLTNTFVGGMHDSQHPFHNIAVTTARARYVVDNLYDGLWIYPHDDLNRQLWQPSVFQPRDYQASMVASIRGWLDELRGEPRLAASLEEGITNLKVVSGIIESLEDGKPIRIS